MIDLELNKPLKLMNGGRAGPFLMVPLRQIPSVEAVLTEAHVKYSRSLRPVQPQGGEPVVLIQFGRRGDPTRIQSVLDQH